MLPWRFHALTIRLSKRARGLTPCLLSKGSPTPTLPPVRAP